MERTQGKQWRGKREGNEVRNKKRRAKKEQSHMGQKGRPQVALRKSHLTSAEKTGSAKGGEERRGKR